MPVPASNIDTPPTEWGETCAKMRFGGIKIPFFPFDAFVTPGLAKLCFLGVARLLPVGFFAMIVSPEIRCTWQIPHIVVPERPDPFRRFSLLVANSGYIEYRTEINFYLRLHINALCRYWPFVA